MLQCLWFSFSCLRCASHHLSLSRLYLLVQRGYAGTKRGHAIADGRTVTVLPTVHGYGLIHILLDNGGMQGIEPSMIDATADINLAGEVP